MNTLYSTVFNIFVRLLVVLTALPIHEFAHAYVADKLGDPTAGRMGRLNLNPFAHLDIMGTILILFTGFGFAKPVPVNPNYFKKPKRDMALTALAGPISNILLAIIVMIILKCAYYFIPMPDTVLDAFYNIFYIIIATNLNLAVFNLLPIPPLDGSKILGFFASDKVMYFMQKNQMYLSIILFVLLLSGLLSTPLSFLSSGLYKGIYYLTYFIDAIAGAI